MSFSWNFGVCQWLGSISHYMTKSWISPGYPLKGYPRDKLIISHEFIWGCPKDILSKWGYPQDIPKKVFGDIPRISAKRHSGHLHSGHMAPVPHNDFGGPCAWPLCTLAVATVPPVPGVEPRPSGFTPTLLPTRPSGLLYNSIRHVQLVEGRTDAEDILMIRMSFGQDIPRMSSGYLEDVLS